MFEQCDVVGMYQRPTELEHEALETHHVAPETLDFAVNLAILRPGLTL